MKKVLILGAHSYIGTFFQNYLRKNYPTEFEIGVTSLRERGISSGQEGILNFAGSPWDEDWSEYDAVLNVTGIAHADIETLVNEAKEEYYKVNCDLAVKAAKKAFESGVSQYIYFSSIIVYGDGSDKRRPFVITKDTKPHPSNFYGDSKWRAEKQLTELFDSGTKTKLAILRPPMVYGRDCKGNFRTLQKMAKKLPFFPDYANERSMIYIGNLCEFLAELIRRGEGGLFFPQNKETVKTAELVRLLAEAEGRTVRLLRVLTPFVDVLMRLPGKTGRLIRKAFGSVVYEKSMSDVWGGSYQKYSLSESMEDLHHLEA